jgi:cytochrome b
MQNSLFGSPPMQQSAQSIDFVVQPGERLERLDDLALLDAGLLRAWDLPTRLFKWSLAAGVAIAYGATWLPDGSMTLHKLAGYFILSLVIFRAVWGFIGSRTARFASFVRGPRAIIAHIRRAARGQGWRFLGHNPAGGAMILALLALCAAQGLTGLFSSDGVLAGGPFADFLGDESASLVTAAHKVGFYILLGAIVLHIAANVYYQGVKREPLITAMVTGVKPADEYYADFPAQGGAGALAALAVFAASALLLAGGVWAFGGSLL